MKKPVCFRGVGTALVTPFSGGEIDYTSLKRLIDAQIKAGVAAIIIGGTTGEAATLSEVERERLYAFCAEKIGGRVKLLFGTGSLDTRSAMRYTRLASKLSADGALCVTPYYNKGTENGLYYHFLSVAESADIPTIIYNVPTRTSVNIGIKTLERLSTHVNIAGLKESSDSLSRLSELAALGENLPLYSGNDYANCLFYSVGAAGSISVTANLFPSECVEIHRMWQVGEHTRALTMQNKMRALNTSLFTETNPSPVKFALERLGLCKEEVRLPLTPPTSKAREIVAAALDNYQKSLHG